MEILDHALPRINVSASMIVVEHHVTKVKMVVVPVLFPPCVHLASTKRRHPLLPQTVSVPIAIPVNTKVVMLVLPVPIVEPGNTKVVTVELPVLITPPLVHPASINR